jgi:hypothetical protein
MIENDVGLCGGCAIKIEVDINSRARKEEICYE